MNEFAQALRKRRQELGLTTLQAALDADVSQAVYSCTENGRLPNLLNFKRLCRWLKQDYNWGIYKIFTECA